MQWQILKKGILDKQLPPFVILTGDEALISIYKEQIFNNFNVKVLNNLDDYYSNAMTKKIIKDDYVYLITDDEVLKNNNKLWGLTFKNLILIYTKLDKKSKFYKAFENYIIDFEKLEDNILKALVKNRLEIQDSDMDWLVKNCNSDYFNLLNEVDKVKIFDKQDHQRLFNSFKKDNTIIQNQTLEPFAFSNAIMNRDKIGCLNLLSKIKKEDIIGELSSVYNSLRNSLIAQTSNYDSSLKMSDKQFNYLKRNCKYTALELCNMLLYISKSLNDIKFGILDSMDAINILILKI